MAGRRTVSSTEDRGKKKKTNKKKKKKKSSRIFSIRKQNSSFGNSYSNLDFLIITNHSGGLAAMLNNVPDWVNRCGNITEKGQHKR